MRRLCALLTPSGVLAGGCLSHGGQAVFLAVFLINYRVEYLLLMPAITTLFAYYLVLSTRPESVAQKPENLSREPGLVALVAVVVAIFVYASVVDVAWIGRLRDQEYITLPLARP